MRKVGDKFGERNVLSGWFDGRIIRAEPDREDTNFGNMLLFMLLQTDRHSGHHDENRPTCSKTGMAHSELYPESPRLITSNFLAYTSKEK
jgi:hypothetical protein